MTEEEWLTCGDVRAMFELLEDKMSERKLRLFGGGCCRRILHLVSDRRSIEAVDVIEKYADSRSTKRQLTAASNKAYAAADPTTDYSLWTIAFASDPTPGGFLESYFLTEPGDDSDERAEAALLREVIGNPFRPVAMNPIWLTATISGLATAAYNERNMPSGHLDMERLAVLSDALEETGCDDVAILDHLRSPGPHVRGCWVLDLLLGKE